MRKSPIRHHVRTHQRQTSDGKTTIHDYDRGHGSHPNKISKPKLRKPQQAPASFLVHINYVGQKSESFPVNASSYPEAIEYALLARASVTPPSLVEASKQ